ncbi:MAG: NAD-dependent epimerase/dehydratase family protein [Dehalococcoidia bacterium]
MNIESYWVQSDARLVEAIAVLERTTHGMLLVVDADRRLLGALTRTDIRRALLEGALVDQPVTSVMRSPVPVLRLRGSEPAEVRHAAVAGGLPFIPVVDDAGCPIDLLPASGDTVATDEHILVSGGAGYVGSVLVRRLLAAGHRVTLFDRFLYGEASIGDLLDHPRLRIVRGDTRHVEDLTPLVAEATAVVQLAELVGDPLCAQDPLKTLEINLLGSTNVAAIAARFQVTRFVYISSCSVYGSSSNPDAILDEGSALAPLSIYAKMKIAAEQSIRRLEYGAFSPVIFRLGTVFGMSPRPRFDLVVNTLTAQAVQDGAISVFGGDQWRPHVHVDDVARGIQMALAAPRERVAGTVMNLVGENLKIAELGDLIAEEVPGARVTVQPMDGDKRNYRVSADRAAHLLDFEPRWTVRRGVQQIKAALESGTLTHHTYPVYSNIRALSGVQL